MTDILGNFTCNEGSENEDIKRLFPKCKPKNGGSDINLNKIRDYEHYNYNLAVNAKTNKYSSLIDVFQDANKNTNTDVGFGVGGGGGGGGIGGAVDSSSLVSTPLRRRSRGDVYGSVVNNTLALLSPNQNEKSLKYDQDHNNTYSISSNSSSSGRGSVSPRSYVGQRRSSAVLSEFVSKGAQGVDQSPMYDFGCAEEQHILEDSSVISAYDHCSNMERNGHNKEVGTGSGLKLTEQNVDEEDTAYENDSLDVGYRIPVMREEFKLRESRIEIAGGREVFSTSRGRPPKKRFSDEILYHRSTSDHELKRHSGDVLHDDHQSTRYQGNSVASRIATEEDLSQSSIEQSSGHSNEQKLNYDRHKTRHNHHVNKIVCNVDEIRTVRNGTSRLKDRGCVVPHRGHHRSQQSSVGGLEGVREPVQYQHSVEHGKELESPKETFVLKGQRSGMFIYETVVCGTSEVVYDDIGEWDTDEFARQREMDGSPSIDNRKSNNLEVFPKRLDTSVDAVNSEDVMSEREDGVSSQEGASSHSSATKVNNGLGDAVVSSNRSSKDVHTVERDPDGHSSSDDMDTESGQSSSSIKSSAAKLIGSLPIAQYEGSPRRYGPRPGYPQRLTISSDVPCTTTTTITTASGQGSGESLPTYNSLFSTVETQGKRYDGDNSKGCSLDQDIPRSLVSKPFVSDCGEITTNSDDNVEELKIGGETPPNIPSSFATYDYQYEESETRKVLEEFYHQDGLFARLKESGTLSVEAFNELEYRLYRVNAGNSYVGRRLAHSYVPEVEDSPKKRPLEKMQLLRDQLLSNMAASGLLGGKGRLTSLSKENVYNFNLERDRLQERGLILPTDQDGETVSTNPDTEDLAETEIGEQVGQSRNFTLSPETTDCDSNDVESEVSMDNEGSLNSSSRQYSSMPVLEDGLSSGHSSEGEHEHEGDEGADSDHDRPHDNNNLTTLMMKKQISEIEREIARRAHHKHPKHDLPQLQQHFQQPHVQPSPVDYREVEEYLRRCDGVPGTPPRVSDIDLNTLDPLRDTVDSSSPPPPPAPHPHRSSPPLDSPSITCESVSEAINEIKQAIRKTKSITLKSPPMEKPEAEDAPIWVLRPAYKQLKSSKDGEGEGRGAKEEGHHHHHQEEDECDTDQETDRLLGKQRTEESSNFLEDKRLSESLSSTSTLPSSPLLGAKSTSEFSPQDKEAQKKKGRTKEVLIHEPAVLIEGVLFRARYLGSTQLVCEGQPTKATRMMQAEEAVSRIKAPEGETQPSTEVDLFISTEKIMVLNTDLKEIMMDHALRTISYIADIGDLVVLMARRRVLSTVDDPEPKLRRTSKMICHVFESEEAQFIAQSIGQAFQVAYMEFLKANGIEDHSFVKEMDYQEVLNSQEIFGDELEMFAKKEMQKEVIVPKLKGEILGVVIVESGWGSMLPTVVIANLSPNGAAARCGQLNIGDQIIAINGISLVGLPLSTCQTYIKSAKNQTVVKLTVVPCAPVVEVKIKRPDTKYQLGFSVQNGVICSLLRGGIAERGGVRVGHRIIEINGQSVVAVPHERIVNLLATSVGEIHMKTMPTSMFRLLTGQESPLFI